MVHDDEAAGHLAGPPALDETAVEQVLRVHGGSLRRAGTRQEWKGQTGRCDKTDEPATPVTPAGMRVRLGWSPMSSTQDSCMTLR